MSLTTEPPVNEQISSQASLPPLPPPKRRDTRAWILGILVGGTLGVILVGSFIWMTTGLGVLHLLGTFQKSGTRINVDQPTVVQQVQKLQRLETVNYTMDKIISGEHANQYLPKFLAGDRLLLIVHGEAVAGINLATLRANDVTVHGDSVSIHLPTAEVFITRIDNTKTRVYSRDTGLFSTPDPNLETEVREEAERQLSQAALQDGILASAAENAKTTITGLLHGFGFRDVEIR